MTSPIKTLTLATIALAAQNCWGQQELTGRISDSAGSAVAGSAVIIRESSGLSMRTTTDASGRYRFEGVAPGPYTLRVSKEGFQVREYEVTVADQPLTLDAQLLVAADGSRHGDAAAAPAALRALFRDAIKPKWAHVQLLGRMDASSPASSADASSKQMSLWQAAALDAIRHPAQLANVFGTTTQQHQPATIGYRFHF